MDDKVQQATALFVEQLRTRPENVVSNCNSLLSGSGFRLELVQDGQRCEHSGALLGKKSHPDPYMFPFMTGERSVATV